MRVRCWLRNAKSRPGMCNPGADFTLVLNKRNLTCLYTFYTKESSVEFSPLRNSRRRKSLEIHRSPKSQRTLESLSHAINAADPRHLPYLSSKTVPKSLSWPTFSMCPDHFFRACFCFSFYTQPWKSTIINHGSNVFTRTDE